MEEYRGASSYFSLDNFHHERFKSDEDSKLIVLSYNNNEIRSFLPISEILSRFLRTNNNKQWCSFLVKNASLHICSYIEGNDINSRTEVDKLYSDLRNLQENILKEDFLVILDFLYKNFKNSKIINTIYHKTLLDINLFSKYYFNSSSNILMSDFNNNVLEFIKKHLMSNSNYVEWFSFIRRNIVRSIKNMFLTKYKTYDENFTTYRLGTKEDIFCNTVFNYSFDSNLSIGNIVVDSKTELYKTLTNIYNINDMLKTENSFRYYHFNFVTYNVLSNICKEYNVYKTKNNDFTLVKK